MNIKEKAKSFAIQAHKGQVRKSEPDKPMIIHPIGVGMLLEEYGCDDNVVAAGYLHDVVEDTKFTNDDIKMIFGSDIAKLVETASEPDKSLSWEERKKHTIEETKHLPLRNKMIICADKINNLEDLLVVFQKTGKRDFSNFKRGEDQQKWYYTEIYKSLIYGEDENLEIFQRLKRVLDMLFEEKEDDYLKDTIFKDKLDYYEELKRLHAQKIELQRLKALCSLEKPFVIEFSGTPRTGKTTTIYNLYDFFKKGGFDVSIIEEFTTSKLYKEELRPITNEMSTQEKMILIMDYVFQQLSEAINSKKDIILIDRSINDRQIWNYSKYISGEMDETSYTKAKEKGIILSKKWIDFLVVTYAEALVSLKRDYLSSLALEKRSFLNTDNIERYNDCLERVKELFEESVTDYLLLDTSSMNLDEVSVKVASEILPVIRKQYVKKLQKKYNGK